MYEKLLKKTAFFTTLFSVLAIGLMVWFQYNKEELVQRDRLFFKDEIKDDYEEVVSADEPADTASGFISVKVDDTKNTNNILISWEDEISEDWDILYDYVNQSISVFCPHMTKKQMEKCNVQADGQIVLVEEVRAAFLEKADTFGIVFELPLKGYFDGELIKKEKQLELSLKPIEAQDFTTVVLDAGHGGMDFGDYFEGMKEKDLTMRITSMVKEMLEKDDIRVFCTRASDIDATEEARVRFANTIKADMLVSVHYTFLKEESEQKKEGLTAIYNGQYFIPDFGSIELANILSEETIKKVGGVANGMNEAGIGNELVNGARIPVALIEIDHIVTNENKLALASDKNLKRIAEGIYEGIKRAKDTMQGTTK